MSQEIMMDSLWILINLLQKHYRQKVIVLIDEYDVPLDKAQHSGYYDEMVGLIRNLFSRALKSNPSLHLAVLTGCLQIAMSSAGRHLESIFTGLNNLRVLSIASVLFTTGYLTQCGSTDARIFQLVIPNLEIREIFTEQIYEWFQEETRRDTPKLDAFCAAFPLADAEVIEGLFTAYLKKTISIRDTSVRKNKKENFYHGILLGLLSHREDWIVSSNAESGVGFSDILIEIEDSGVGIVIEIKYPDNGNLDAGCQDALSQIEEKGYAEHLRQNGMETIIKYGIACYKKTCKVICLHP